MAPWLVLWLSACGGGEEAGGDGPAGSDAYVPPVLPVLEVTAPARASFTGSSEIRVQGTVVAGDAAIASLTIDGEEVPFEGGAAPGATATFDVHRDWEPGIRIIGVRVEDADGERAVDGRAVYAGPVHEVGATIADAIRMNLGPSLLDDDEPDLDDVAALGEVLLDDASLAQSIVGVPIDTGDFVITPTSLSWNGADVDLAPRDGALDVAVTLHDIWMDFDVEGTGWYSWVSTSGSAWADTGTLEMTVAVSVTNGAVHAEATSSSASLGGYGITVDWFPDSLEGWLADQTQETIEEQIAATAEDAVGALVAETVGAFAQDVELLGGVRVVVGLSDLAVAPDGVRLTLDAAAIADSIGVDLPAGAGSLDTDGGPPAWPLDGAHPFAVACDDDFVNQLLFAVWATGALGGMEVGGTEIGLLAGQEVPAPLGPLDAVDLDLLLPPVLSPPTEDDQDADLSIGEFRLAFHREDGETLSFSVNVRTGVTVEMDEAGSVDLALDGRPARMTLEIGTLEHPEALDPGDLAALVRLMVPPLFMNAGAFLPAFEIPDVPLDAVDDSLAGRALGFEDPALSVDPDGRWVVLGARVVER